jgi:hypothetical protein
MRVQHCPSHGQFRAVPVRTAAGHLKSSPEFPSLPAPGTGDRQVSGGERNWSRGPASSPLPQCSIRRPARHRWTWRGALALTGRLV